MWINKSINSNHYEYKEVPAFAKNSYNYKNGCEQFIVILDKYNIKEIITIKIKNITEGSYDRNTIYNKTLDKNINISYNSNGLYN